MKNPVSDENTNNTILNQVQEGMDVCNNEGEKIGRVRKIFLGAVTDEMDERGRGPATASDPEWRDETIVDNLAEVLTADDPLPATVRGQLLRLGFLRIDTSGIFTSDRFALPDQIESVSEDCVRLRVETDELIAR
jgi:hypothetical protein